VKLKKLLKNGLVFVKTAGGRVVQITKEQEKKLDEDKTTPGLTG
jgi:hypothetical protein